MVENAAARNNAQAVDAPTAWRSETLEHGAQLSHSSNDPERPARMSDSGDESQAWIILEPLSLSRIKIKDHLIGFVCVRRNPPAPILAAKPGFRLLLEVLNRIFGVHFSRSGVLGHLFFLHLTFLELARQQGCRKLSIKNDRNQ
ncbi:MULTISPECIES: hypothetical protein [unclassified Ensifer]|uniref:hypothetical protein n=1 Tax=unclassified Ensifer TaxID=2633371 RepID=UPI000A53B16E|nr:MULTISPECIES: hypothetical protein [unclassified Ensifer]